ncbi:MAG TPA: hypothetical protein VIM10_08080 [Actinopolymorphaceae bacterium]
MPSPIIHAPAEACPRSADRDRVFTLPGMQMADTSLRAEPDPEAVELGADDIPEMLDLIARTQPARSCRGPPNSDATSASAATGR